MTNATTPIEATFEMQRQSIKQSQQLVEQGLQFQENAAEMVFQNGMGTQRRAQSQGADIVRTLVHTQLDAVESAMDDAEHDARSAIDEQFEDGAKRTQQLLNEQFDHGTEMFKQVLHAQFDALESILEEEGVDMRSAVDEQFAAFEQTHEDTWEEFESEFLGVVEELTGQQQRLLADSIDSLLEAHEETEQQAIEGVRQADALAEQTEEHAQDLVGEAAVATTETTDAIETAVETGSDAAEQTLQSIDGIGETYAHQLADVGVETIGDLAQTTTETVAEATSVSHDRAREWIQAAQSHD